MVRKGATIANRTPNKDGTRSDSKLDKELQYKIIFDLENAPEGQDSTACILGKRKEYKAEGREKSVRSKINRLQAKKRDKPEEY